MTFIALCNWLFFTTKLTFLPVTVLLNNSGVIWFFMSALNGLWNELNSIPIIEITDTSSTTPILLTSCE